MVSRTLPPSISSPHKRPNEVELDDDDQVDVSLGHTPSLADLKKPKQARLILSDFMTSSSSALDRRPSTNALDRFRWSSHGSSSRQPASTPISDDQVNRRWSALSFTGTVSNTLSNVASSVLFGFDNSAREGIKNLGNTCYINATLQALFHLPTLKNDLLQKSFKNSSHMGTIYRAFIDILTEKDETKIVDPARFKQVIGEASAQFATHDQQDADEFLRFILDRMEMELVPFCRPTSAQDASDENADPTNKQQQSLDKLPPNPIPANF